ncbi:hypothetical protein LIER_40942 [Lithospermum erythrorhizon]|uniref:Reverse transcriptase n=1 Tax=Lithospermum erythrorhizon TaxID=34254 RepID=A0AAV3R7R4_LITER
MIKEACESESFDREGVLGMEKELDEAWDEEERYWFAKSRSKHLKEGDKNTRFFHASTLMRRRKGSDVGDVILEYFRDIFSANDSCVPENATSVVDRRVTEEMNQRLTRFITSEDVKAVVFDMPIDKSPGPDRMTGLTCMLRDTEERRALTGIKIARDCPSINHILFVDDTLVFCKATVEEGKEIKWILEDYEVALGQKVNMGKCSINFEPRTSPEVRVQVLQVLGMREVSDQGKYLGLPSHIGRRKKEVFQFINVRVKDCIRGWKGKLLSQVRKEVLIKSVSSAIPNFVMNCFQLPIGTVAEMNKAMANFMWASSDGGKGIHWKA